eukprot:Lithocolla_globosa_v1_NODE_3498_length_1655_cov_24.973750.p1 type:complete len:469 gc:universal NODE_3498_length_1655_cov_24.973750:1484-78(-)
MLWLAIFAVVWLWSLASLILPHQCQSLAKYFIPVHEPNENSNVLIPDLSTIYQWNLQTSLFCFIIFLCFLADGPHDSWIETSERLFETDFFLTLISIIFLFGVFSIRETRQGVDTILSREQTEEWKGIMQIGFVLYHYFKVAEAYNLIRLFIGAYVWMTGFGNFSFFWVKKDYSLMRMIKTLLRLNLSVAVLCGLMDRNYMLYYVCPLHTFFYLTTYVTMAIYPQMNYEPFWMRIKFLVHFVILFVLFEVPSVFETVWLPLYPLVQLNDSLHEWHFRSGLDHYASFFGMLFAYNYPTLEMALKWVEDQAPLKHLFWKGLVLVVMIIILIPYYIYVFTLNKFEYNYYHPYTSFIPITAYIILRNMVPLARKKVIGVFQWCGTITLETYLLQFHIWLVHDAKYRLVLIPNFPHYTFFWASVGFVALSYMLFQSSVFISGWLVPNNLTNSALLFRFGSVLVILALCTFLKI